MAGGRVLVVQHACILDQQLLLYYCVLCCKEMTLLSKQILLLKHCASQRIEYTGLWTPEEPTKFDVNMN